MEQQKIIWTVIPNGYSQSDPSKVRLSVFVSPRLSSTQSNPTLDLFGDFLDWPATLQGLDFGLQFGAGAPVAAQVVGQPLESTLWKALFTKTAAVASYDFPDATSKNIRSYPYANVETWIKQQYQDIIVGSQTELPSSQMVAAKLTPIMFYEAPDPDADTKKFTVNSSFTAARSKPVMQRVATKGKLGETFRMKSPDNSTRLQTGNIHPQLNTVLTNIPDSIYTTAMLDLMHLTQEPTVVFTPLTMSAISSIYSELASNKAVNNMGAVEPTKDFLQVTFFHRPKQPHIVAVAKPDIDFHQAIASLSNYPEIMKRVGVVIELEVPAASVSGDTVRLLPVKKGQGLVVGNLWNGSDATDNVRPKTKFEHNGGSKIFRALPKGGSNISGGLMDISGSQYKLTNLDVDGAAMKMMGLANTLRHYTPPDLKPKRLAGLEPVAAESMLAPTEFTSKAVVVEQASLPALRTAGVTLIKTNQALGIVAKIAAAKTMNTMASAGSDDALILYYDDIVKGYRVDIHDAASNTWRSLCARKGTYTFERTGETRNYDDEGFVEIAASSAADQSIEELQKSWYIPEVLTSWNGWSKVAPQPGKKIVQPDDPAQDDTWNDNPNTAENDYGLATNFRVQPGTLPRLRYGNTYRMRLRVVDLAGNSLSLENAPSNTNGATGPMVYTRFEPVPAPFLVPKTAIKPGESVEHVVIRSNYNMSPADYATLFPSPLHPAYPSERHVVPSRQAQRMAEEYGRFDDPSTGVPIPSRYTQITSNDAFFPPFDAKQASKAVRPEQQIGVPWLPDVAPGTTFVGLPGLGAGTIRKVTYGPFSNWPDLQPFILRLVEGNTAPQETDEAGVKHLSVSLGKAMMAKVKYSSNIEMVDLQKMAVWKWLQEKGGVDQQKALDGLNWSITPYRGLTLIHVVQQPLSEPVITMLKAEKKLGDTFAMLSGKISVDGKSTSRLDTYAEWDEPIDNLALPGPKTLKKRNLAFEDGIDSDDTTFEFPPPAQSDAQILDKMAGKRSLSVTGTAKSLVSYRVQNDASMAKKMKATSTRKMTVSSPVSNVRAKDMLAPVNLKSKEEAPDERRRHDFGDTKYRRVKYRSIATSRFREYFLDILPETTPKFDSLDAQRTAEADSSNRLLTRTGTVTTVDILNSARPEAPKVLYIVPSFGWEKEEDGDSTISKRVSGLRVWMERPWYSSGDGEMLGVIIWPTSGPKKSAPSSSTSTSSPSGIPLGGAKGYKTDIKSMPGGGMMGVGSVADSLKAETVVPDKLLPYVTQWGADPIWLSGKLRSLPATGDFLNAVIDHGLSMSEFPEQKGDEFVSVAAYSVGYDTDRRLWYCDIEVNPHEAYFPFIRMGLARYQPKSVNDAHLSRIVMADYIQIAPDRSVTITPDASNARSVRVAVTGLTYRASAAGQFPSEVEVTVETATGPSGDLEWIPADGSNTFGLDRLGGFGQKLWQGLWAGEIKLPAERGSKPMRLVIREFEVLLGDGTELPEGFDLDGATATEIQNGAKPQLQRRLVYADVVEL